MSWRTHAQVHETKAGGEPARSQQRPPVQAPASRAGAAAGGVHPTDLLRLQPTLGNRAVARLATGAGQAPLARRPPNTTGLPDGLKASIEALSGTALDDVRVRYNSPRPAALGAFASTRGAEIDVAPGQERHLAHEAWHVVQQKQGRVQATTQAKGQPVNDEDGLEHEADVMGARALRMATIVERGSDLGTAPAQRQAPAAVTQMATHLRYETTVDGNSTITATQHTRGPVHKQAANWVLDNGAWKSAPGGTVCNHSKDYDQMAQSLLDAIHDEELVDAVTTVKGTYETLQAKNQGLGTAINTHRQRMADVIADPTDDIDVDDMNDTFNYYIYKICDYPRNLFFWPDRTGGNPDEPRGQYDDANAPDPDWEVRNSIISKNQRLIREKKRLSDGRSDLSAALP